MRSGSRHSNSESRSTVTRVAIKPEDVKIDIRAEVLWDHITPELTLPKFQPASS